MRRPGPLRPRRDRHPPRPVGPRRPAGPGRSRPRTRPTDRRASAAGRHRGRPRERPGGHRPDPRSGSTPGRLPGRHCRGLRRAGSRSAPRRSGSARLIRSVPSARLTTRTSARPAATHFVPSGTARGSPPPTGSSPRHIRRFAPPVSPASTSSPSSRGASTWSVEQPPTRRMPSTSPAVAASGRDTTAGMARRSVPSGVARRRRGTVDQVTSSLQ